MIMIIITKTLIKIKIKIFSLGVIWILNFALRVVPYRRLPGFGFESLFHSEKK
jgi:hypothetical protein